MGRRAIALTGAILLALAAAGLAWWYVSSVRSETVEQEETVRVLVAAEDIPARTTGESVVANKLVQQEEVPRRLVAPGALTAEGELQGKVTQAGLSKGQQVVSAQLAAPETESLSFRVSEGMRAVAVTVDRARAVAGLVEPGDRVDVIVTFAADVLNEGNADLGQVMPAEEVERVRSETGIDLDGTSSAVTRIVLQQVQVLHIDPVDDIDAEARRAAEDEDTSGAPNLPVAVLMVTPHDAEKLVFAQEMGVVAFSLIPAEDTDTVNTPGRVLGNEFAPSPEPPQEAEEVVPASSE